MTVLCAPGATLAKVYRRHPATGQMEKVGYSTPRACGFLTELHPVTDGLTGLLPLRRELQWRSDTCTIRAVPGPYHRGLGVLGYRRELHGPALADILTGAVELPVSKSGAKRDAQQARIASGQLVDATLLAPFVEVPSWIVSLDFDRLAMPDGGDWRPRMAEAARYCRSRLPDPFRTAACIYWPTGSAGDLSKPDLGGPQIKLRQEYQLSTPLTEVQLKRFLAGPIEHRVIDDVTLRAVQINYHARPVYRDGLVDPIPDQDRQPNLLDGDDAVVRVPEWVLDEPRPVVTSLRRAMTGSDVANGKAVPQRKPPPRPFVPAVSTLGLSADGVGLQPSPRLEGALDRLTEAGQDHFRGTAMWAAIHGYIDDVGADQTDAAALAREIGARVVATGRRTPAEVDGYGIHGMVLTVLASRRAAPPPVSLALLARRQPEPGSDEAEPRGEPEEDEDQPTVSPLTAAEGAALQSKEVADFLAAGAHADGKPLPKPPHWVITGPPGLGKTQALIDGQIALQQRIRQALQIESYSPTTRLNDEVAVRYVDANREHAATVAAATKAAKVRKRKVFSVVPAVIRGRGQIDSSAPVPDDPNAEPARMCVLHELNKELAEKGGSPQWQVCGARRRGRCPHHKGCAYVEQFHSKNCKARLFPHASLFAPRNRRLPAPNVTGVDESFWRAGIEERILPLAELHGNALTFVLLRKGARRRDFDVDKRHVQEIADRVREAFENGVDYRTVVTGKQCELVRDMTLQCMPQADIEPWMSDEQKKRVLAKFDPGFALEQLMFWDLAVGEFEWLDMPLLRIVLGQHAGSHAPELRLLRKRPLRGLLEEMHGPLLFLDADYDPVIHAAFFGEPDKVVNIRVRPAEGVLTVVQITDQAVSMRFLLGREGDTRSLDAAKQHRAELIAFCSRKMPEGGLLVSYKKAIELMRQEGLPDHIETAHFGALRGLDSFGHHDVMVVAGRMEPPVLAIENHMRAIHDGSRPLILIPQPAIDPKTGKRPRHSYQRVLRRLRMADGSLGPLVMVSEHPDPLGSRLLHQDRECETRQAAGRLRLLHRPAERPATVYLLANLPITGLEPSVTSTWNELVAGSRAEEASRRWEGWWYTFPADQSRMAPDLWPSTKTAENDQDYATRKQKDE
jgi:hypothetical protein